MRRTRNIAWLVLLVASAASTGLLRVGHELTAHLCACVSGLVVADGCADGGHAHHHRGHASHASHANDTGGAADEPGHNHENHGPTPDGHDCDICAVLLATARATLTEAPSLALMADVVASVEPTEHTTPTVRRVRAWSARGPPILG